MSMKPWLVATALWLCAGGALAANVPAEVTRICAECHGQDGNSSDAKIPRLAGLQVGYLSKQLRDFAGGLRRNEIMAPIAGALGSDGIQALANYFSVQVPVPVRSGDAALLDAGRQVFEEGNAENGVPACVGCHQANGAGNVRFPRVAGQHAAYLERQLQAFKHGRRANNRLMVTVTQRMSDEEIRAVAAYVESLKVQEKP